MMSEKKIQREGLLAHSLWVGCAKVKIEDIEFVSRVSGKLVRPLEAKNVCRLKRVFELEGIHRLLPENYIGAKIGRIRPEQLSQKRGQESPAELRVPVGTRVVCLFGRHRVAAAKAVLPRNQQWWVVDFYGDVQDSGVLWHIASEHSNSKAFNDGFIFRNLRWSDNTPEEKTWLAMLSAVKQRDYKQLCCSHNARLLAALDALLPFIGLWEPFLLGTFHRILNMRCIPELVHYLDLVRRAWSDFIGDVVEAQQLDSQTVVQLQLLYPSKSKRDRSKIKDLFDNRLVFSEVTNAAQIEELQRRILAYPSRIPSLCTFLEDTKYLEPCAKIMKALVDRKWQMKEQIEDKMGEIYDGPPREWKRRYRTLWLYAVRNFSDLTDAAPRKDAGKAKPVVRETSTARWREFGALAQSLDFCSSKIEGLATFDVEKATIRAFVEKLFPDIAEADCDGLIASIQGLLQGGITRVEEDTNAPVFTTDLVDVPLDHRCGRPFEEDFERDRRFYSMRRVYGLHNIRPQRYISSFAVACAIFHAFFGLTESETSEPAGEESVNSDVDMLFHVAGQGNSANFDFTFHPNPGSSSNTTGPDTLRTPNTRHLRGLPPRSNQQTNESSSYQHADAPLPSSGSRQVSEDHHMTTNDGLDDQDESLFLPEPPANESRDSTDDHLEDDGMDQDATGASQPEPPVNKSGDSTDDHLGDDRMDQDATSASQPETPVNESRDSTNDHLGDDRMDQDATSASQPEIPVNKSRDSTDDHLGDDRVDQDATSASQPKTPVNESGDSTDDHLGDDRMDQDATSASQPETPVNKSGDSTDDHLGDNRMDQDATSAGQPKTPVNKSGDSTNDHLGDNGIDQDATSASQPETPVNESRDSTNDHLGDDGIDPDATSAGQPETPINKSGDSTDDHLGDNGMDQDRDSRSSGMTEGLERVEGAETTEVLETIEPGTTEVAKTTEAAIPTESAASTDGATSRAGTPPTYGIAPTDGAAATGWAAPTTDWTALESNTDDEFGLMEKENMKIGQTLTSSTTALVTNKEQALSYTKYTERIREIVRAFVASIAVNRHDFHIVQIDSDYDTTMEGHSEAITASVKVLYKRNDHQDLPLILSQYDPQAVFWTFVKEPPNVISLKSTPAANLDVKANRHRLIFQTRRSKEQVKPAEPDIWNVVKYFESHQPQRRIIWDTKEESWEREIESYMMDYFLVRPLKDIPGRGNAVFSVRRAPMLGPRKRQWEREELSVHIRDPAKRLAKVKVGSRTAQPNAFPEDTAQKEDTEQFSSNFGQFGRRVLQAFSRKTPEL